MAESDDDDREDHEPQPFGGYGMFLLWYATMVVLTPFAWAARKINAARRRAREWWHDRG